MYRKAQSDKALLKFVEESGSWVAAKALAIRYFEAQGTKFVTCFKHEGHWIAAQWVTTSSRLFDVGPQVELGRVGISPRRQKAIRQMWRSRWLFASVTEPQGITIGVQIFNKVGNK